MDEYINPCAGRISSKFGTRTHPVTKKKSFHNGVDISVPVGTKIAAPADGIITEYWEHTKGGKCLAMETEDGVRFGFAHLNKRLVVKDTKVTAGEHIAESGNTGASTGPHLHFTVKENDTWIDPLKYFTFK